MKKILISLGAVIAIALYAIFGGKPGTVSVAPDITLNETSTAGPTTSAGNQTAGQAPNNPTPTPTKKTSGAFKDGTYTGPVADAFYGPMQVQAIIKGGKLADVKALQYPTDRETSTSISNQAIPILVQEAIASQSANVDVVSGATQTSEGFQQSLAAALAMAK